MSRYLLLAVVLIAFGFTLGVSEFSHAQSINCSTHERPSDAPDLDDLIDTLKSTRECTGCNLICATLNNTDLSNTRPNTPNTCLLYTSPSPRDRTRSRMPSSA